MIRAGLTITAMPNSRRLERVFNRAVYGMARESVERTRDKLLVLVAPPPSVSYPIKWTSDRQRMAVMAKLRREGNLPYRRTGRLPAAWQYTAVQGIDGAVSIVLRNPSKVAKFVYGSFRAFGSPQQQFHVNSGWGRSRAIRDELFAAVRVELNALYIETLAGLGRMEIGR